MRVYIEFDLENNEIDDRSSLKHSLTANDYFLALRDIVEHLRMKKKYGSEDEKEIDLYNDIYDDICDIISSREIILN